MTSELVIGGVSNNTINASAGAISTLQGGSGNSNYINLSGANITSAIIGGTSGNIINLNSIINSTTLNLYGSTDSNSTGNTLNVYTKGNTANNVYNFDLLNFYIPSDTADGDTMLTLTDTEGTDISNSTVQAGVSGSTSLKSGNSITLLTNSNGLTTADTTYGTLSVGISTDYGLTVTQVDNSVIASITASPNDPQQSASNNTVTFNAADYKVTNTNGYTHSASHNGVVNSLIGGLSDSTFTIPDDTIVIIGGNETGVEASNNKVDINGGTITGAIYGGNAYGNDARNNVVRIYNSPVLSGANIYGGHSNGGTSSGNILEVHTVGLTANNIYDFQQLDFYIPSSAVNGNTLLTLTDSAGTDISNSTVRAGIEGGSALVAGNVINLLSNSKGITANNVTYGKLSEGISADYDLTVTKSENKIVANITAPDPSEASSHNIHIRSQNYTIGNNTSSTNHTYSGTATTVMGGYSGSNSTFLNPNSSIIIGGSTTTGNASSNKITLEGGTVTGGVYGGYSEDGNSSNNTINLNGSAISGSVWGGWSNSGNTSDNIINIYTPLNGSYSLYGGNQGSTGNKLNIYSASNTLSNVYNFSTYNFHIPASVVNGDTILTLTDTSGTDISNSTVNAGIAGDSNLTYGNKITLMTNSNGLKAEEVSFGKLSEGISIDYSLAVDSDNNSITLTLAENKGPDDPTPPEDTLSASNNTVIVTGSNYTIKDTTKNYTGRIDNIYGGYSGSESLSGNNIVGGSTKIGNANNNSVTISDGTFTNVYGGYSASADASENNIEISGGTYNGSIVGGYGTTANNNKINISGSPNLTAARIYGGLGSTSAGYMEREYIEKGEVDRDHTSGNVLNFYSLNQTALNIGNFGTLNFYIPSEAVNGDTMLTLTDINGTDISGAVVKAGVTGGSNLSAGDTINLLVNNNGLTANSMTYGALTEGVSNDFDLSVSKGSDNNIIAKINQKSTPTPTERLKEQTKAVVQATQQSVSMVNAGSDKLTEWVSTDEFEIDAGIKSIASRLETDFEGNVGGGESGISGDFSEGDTSGGDSGSSDDSSDSSGDSENNIENTQPVRTVNGFEVFANMGGSSLKTKTGGGSYVKSKGSSYDMGFARSFNTGSGLLSVAPVVEYGTGNYDSYLTLSDGKEIHGHGSSRYVAGGLIARMTNNSGFYYEGSFRGGQSTTDFNSTDLTVMGQNGVPFNYKMRAPVFAGHAKIGNLLRMDRNNLLDVYGVYFFTRQNAMSAHLSSGETYNFSAVDSGRLRVGYKLTSRISNMSRIYMGMAYQYEYSGNSTATYKGVSTPSSGTSGSSGMLELGWQVKPIKGSPWMLDINTTGWIGKQQGIVATAKIKKDF